MTQAFGRSLPAWIYSDPGFFELEQERVFAPPGRSSAT